MKYVQIYNCNGTPEYCLELNGNSFVIKPITEVKEGLLDKILTTPIPIDTPNGIRFYIMWSGKKDLCWQYRKIVTTIGEVTILDVTDFAHIPNRPKKDIENFSFQDWFDVLNALTPEQVTYLEWLLDEKNVKEVRHCGERGCLVPMSLFMAVGLYRWEHFKKCLALMPNWYKRDFINKVINEGYEAAMCNEYSKRVRIK